MKEKILQIVDAYWKFDNQQQPMSSWHDKQDLLKALEELLQHDVINQVCDHNWISSVAYKGAKVCSKCGALK